MFICRSNKEEREIKVKKKENNGNKILGRIKSNFKKLRKNDKGLDEEEVEDEYIEIDNNTVEYIDEVYISTIETGDKDVNMSSTCDKTIELRKDEEKDINRLSFNTDNIKTGDVTWSDYILDKNMNLIEKMDDNILDILEKYLEIKDINKLMQTCKYAYEVLDKKHYKYISENMMVGVAKRGLEKSLIKIMDDMQYTSDCVIFKHIKNKYLVEKMLDEMCNNEHDSCLKNILENIITRDISIKYIIDNYKNFCIFNKLKIIKLIETHPITSNILSSKYYTYLPYFCTDDKFSIFKIILDKLQYIHFHHISDSLLSIINLNINTNLCLDYLLSCQHKIIYNDTSIHDFQRFLLLIIELKNLPLFISFIKFSIASSYFKHFYFHNTIFSHSLIHDSHDILSYIVKSNISPLPFYKDRISLIKYFSHYNDTDIIDLLS